MTGGRNGVPPPTTTGLRNMRSSSTRPSSIAAAARPAPSLANKVALRTSDYTAAEIAAEIARVINGDLENAA